MLSGTEKYCDCVATAEMPLPILRHNRRRKLFSVPRVGLQPVSSGHVTGGSLAETWVQGTPSPPGAQLCAWPRSEPA